jgi:hypothetical protein
VTPRPPFVGRYRMLGLDVTVYADVPAIADALAVVLEPFRLEEPGGRRLVIWTEPDGFRVTLDEAWFFDSDSVEGCIQWVIYRLNELVVETPTDRLIVHASVASRDGMALLFPGASGSGKSTLAAGLVRAGFRYLSDELAPIPIGGTLVEPYPRSLTLEQGSWTFFPELEARQSAVVGRDQWFVRASRLGSGCVEDTPRPIAAIVFPTAQPGAVTSLSHISRSDALVELAASTVNLTSHGRPGFRTLAAVARGAAVCARLTAGDVDTAVEAVAGLDLGRTAHRGT